MASISRKSEVIRHYLSIDGCSEIGELANFLSNKYLIVGDSYSVISKVYKDLQDEAKSIKKIKNNRRVRSHSRKKVKPFSIKDLKWMKLRDRVFDKYGKVCLCCGSVDDIQVDHIKPKSIYPELSYCFDNLQPLCASCNIKKSNIHSTDYRLSSDQISHDLSIISSCPF